ncbi:hypothetical protein GGF50DRAFT_62908 [Schizophyllum commune]
MSSAPRKKERSSDGSTRIVCRVLGCEKPTWPNDRELETAKTYHHQRYHQESARIVYQGRSVEIRRDPATGKFPCPCGEPQHARRMAINTRTLCRPRVHPPPDTPSAGEAATDDEGFGFRRATGTQSSAVEGAGSQSSAGTRPASASAPKSAFATLPNAASAPLPRKRRRGSPEVIEVGSDSEDGGLPQEAVRAGRRHDDAPPTGAQGEGGAARRRQGEGGDATPAAEDAAPSVEDAAPIRRETKTERELTLEEKFERNKALERKLHEVSSGFQPAVTLPVFPRLVTSLVLSTACHFACVFHGLSSSFFCVGSCPLACAGS